MKVVGVSMESGIKALEAVREKAFRIEKQGK
jgi:hypothetical protein